MWQTSCLPHLGAVSSEHRDRAVRRKHSHRRAACPHAAVFNFVTATDVTPRSADGIGATAAPPPASLRRFPLPLRSVSPVGRDDSARRKAERINPFPTNFLQAFRFSRREWACPFRYNQNWRAPCPPYLGAVFPNPATAPQGAKSTAACLTRRHLGGALQAPTAI